MNDELLQKHASIAPPRSGQTFARAVSTTPATLDLSSYAGRYVTISAQGGNVFVLFGSVSEAGAVDPAATSGAGQAQMIPSGAVVDYLLGGSDDYIGFATSTGTATMRVHVSSGRTGQ